MKMQWMFKSFHQSESILSRENVSFSVPRSGSEWESFTLSLLHVPQLQCTSRIPISRSF